MAVVLILNAVISGILLIFAISGCGSKKKPNNEAPVVQPPQTPEKIEAIRDILIDGRPDESLHIPGCSFEFGEGEVVRGPNSLPCTVCVKYINLFITQWNKSLHDPEIMDFLAQYLEEDQTYKPFFIVNDVTRKIRMEDEIAKRIQLAQNLKTAKDKKERQDRVKKMAQNRIASERRLLNEKSTITCYSPRIRKTNCSTEKTQTPASPMKASGESDPSENKTPAKSPIAFEARESGRSEWKPKMKNGGESKKN